MRWQRDDEPTLGDRYEATLTNLCSSLLEAAAGHEPHLLGNGETCSSDGDTICDELGGVLFDWIESTFPDEDAASWLDDGPADLLEWHSELGGQTAVEVIAGALRYDAEQRILRSDNGWPVDQLER